MSNPSTPAWTIRSFQPEDQAACHTLYIEGLVGGSLAENDTALDLDDIATNYMSRPGNHFWVAQGDGGRVIGMIGVQHYDEGSGEIRRLRVDRTQLGHGIGSELVETALKFCLEHNYLKVTLDTYFKHDAALRVFSKFRYRMDRSRMLGDREVMYFYADLYTGIPRPHKEDESAVGPSAK